MTFKGLSVGAVVCAAGLTFSLAGCGGSGGEAATPSPPSSPSALASDSASSDVSESAEQEYATVEQYASVVAANRRDIEEYVAKVEDCALGWRKGDLVCALAPLTLMAQAELLRILMSEDAKEEVRLLPPPPEIEVLVARTIEVAGAIKPLADAADDCAQYKGCESEWLDLSFAASDLQEVIDSWAPYL